MDEHEKRLLQAQATVRYMGTQIHERREKLKKSIKGLSVTTGLSCDEIAMIECGEDTGNAADIMVLCEPLGIDYGALLMAALKYGAEHYDGADEKPRIIKGGLYKGKS